MRDLALASNHPGVSPHDGSPQLGPDADPTSTRIDIRVVLVTTRKHRLCVALEADTGGRLRLLRGAAPRREPLDADARRIVQAQIGPREHYLEQLYTVSVDESGRWIVIVAYLALIWFEGAPEPIPPERWFDVESLPPLSAADRMLVDYALIRLRAKLGYTTIAFHLLPSAFTLPELQTTYETILGHPLDKRNFRRRVIAAGFLEPTGDKRRDGNHRPAVVYRFRASHDHERYLTPAWAIET